MLALLPAALLPHENSLWVTDTAIQSVSNLVGLAGSQFKAILHDEERNYDRSRRKKKESSKDQIKGNLISEAGFFQNSVESLYSFICPKHISGSGTPAQEGIPRFTRAQWRRRFDCCMVDGRKEGRGGIKTLESIH